MVGAMPPAHQCVCMQQAGCCCRADEQKAAFVVVWLPGCSGAAGQECLQPRGTAGAEAQPPLSAAFLLQTRC